jgi:hypothetical protein
LIYESVEMMGYLIHISMSYISLFFTLLERKENNEI